MCQWTGDVGQSLGEQFVFPVVQGVGELLLKQLLLTVGLWVCGPGSGLLVRPAVV